MPDDTQSFAQLQWSSWLCAILWTGAMAVVFSRWRRGGTISMDAPTAAFAVLLGLALVSLGVRLISQHDFAFFGPMLRAWAILATELALFVLARQAARAGGGPLYAVVLTLLASSALVAALGVGEYATHFAVGERDWRVYATSSPDFLAAFLVLVLPPTLALFLGSPAAHRVSLLLGLAVVLQLACLLVTGSRFALVSLAAGLIVFALAWRRAGKFEMATTAQTRRRAVILGALALVVGLAAAKPVVNRLLRPEANSGAFRVWTWRGAARMIADNPIAGTGIGTWVSDYPRYALTGFTRLAHNGYLQTGAECGLPALAVLLATLGLTARAGARGLKRKPATEENALAAAVAPADNRLLLAGLLGGLSAGATQNLVDSAWSVFFVGATFWTLAGLTVGLACREIETEKRLPARPILGAAGAVGLGLLLLTATGGTAAWLGNRAQTQPQSAKSALTAASRFDPLTARYPSNLGYKFLAPRGDWAAAETALRRAVALEPSPFNWRRLGAILEQQSRLDEAIAAYQSGLRADPNQIELLLTLARVSSPAESLTLYRRLAALEESPVGTVRALGGVTETAFAVADAAVADRSPAEAPRFFARAARLLESYADEGGSLRRERQATTGGRPRPEQDAAMRDLYTHVMDSLVRLSPAQTRPELRRRQAETTGKFERVIDSASKSG